MFNYAPQSIDYDQFTQCPEDYQAYVKRILAIQAFAEQCGACEMGAQLHLAPNSTIRKSFARIVYDESNHANMLYKILERIGVSESEALLLRQSKNSSGKATESLDGVIAVGDADNTWIDLVLNNMFLDRAGSHMVGNFATSSFTPWAEACEKIYLDEQMHKAFGLKQLKRYVDQHGMNDGLELKIQEWYSHALNFFGPPNVKSQGLLNQYGIKRLSNEDLRSTFIEEVLVVMDEIGLREIVDHALSHEYPYQLLVAA